MKSMEMDVGEDSVSQTSDDQYIPLQIYVPDLLLQKCMSFHRDEIIWSVKQQILSSLPKELKESFNYGLFCPPVNGKAGKFLDEERLLGDYPFDDPEAFLELRYKRRIYKMMNMEEKQVKQLHTRANLRRMLENVSNNHVEKVSKLCARGLDPNFHCPDTGETPLTIAVAVPNSAKLIMTLVNGGALLDFRTKDGRTALHKAVEKDNYESLKTLLDLGASPNYKDSRGLTSLYYSVLYGCDPRITELLLHDHAMIGATDPQGWQEVHQACKHGMVQHLEHLLFYGADMNAHNASGNTPLHVCAVNDQESCARVLLFRGADKNSLNYANQNPYQVAVIAGNLNLAEIIQNHRPEDVVPYREAPKYNPRRRASAATMALLNRTHSDPRMDLTLGLKPPSPCPSNRSLPPFSSGGSTISEASTGSSTCTQPSGDDSEDTASASVVTDKSVTSDSSGVCTSNSGTSYESGSEPPDATDAGIGPGSVCVCIEDYQLPLLGHLNLVRGDLVEVTAITSTGLFEGRTRDGDEGFFPPHCVQEVKLRNTEILPIRQRVEGRRELSARRVSTVPRRWRILDCRYGEPRTVILHKGKKGFGFVLRGAKAATSPLMERQPSEYWPSLQYLDDVDKGGVADMAGLKKGDFLLEINGQDVSQASHEHVVSIIRQSGDLVAMTVVTVQPPPGQGTVDRQLIPRRQCATLPRKLSTKKAPVPPKRDPKTTLSVGRARARSMVAGLAEIEVLDRSLNEYDSEGRSTKSSSIESIPNKQSANTTPSESHAKKIASIRARPSSRRITAAELEEFFSRQRHQEGTTSYSTLPAHLTKGKIPKVYGSVAAMKRCKASRGKVIDLSNKLHKDFHSSPDLNVDEIYQAACNEPLKKRSQSQEELHTVSFRHSHHSLACPPHAYHKTGRETFGDYKDAWKSVEEIYERVKASRDFAHEKVNGNGIYAETLPVSIPKKGEPRSSCPPPSHPPPPPPVGAGAGASVSLVQVVKVDISRSMGEYANVNLNRAEKATIMSSFRPGDSAKLYESPDAIMGVGIKKEHGHSRRSSSGSSLRSQSLPPRIANNANKQQPRSGTSSEAENSGDSGSLYTAFKVLHRQRDSLSSDSGLVSDRGTLKSVKGKSSMARPFSPKFCPDDSEVESPQHYPPLRNQNREPFIPEPDYDSSEEDEIETNMDKSTLVTFGKADGAESPVGQTATEEGENTQQKRIRFPPSPHTEAKRAMQEAKHRLNVKNKEESGEAAKEESESPNANKSDYQNPSPLTLTPNDSFSTQTNGNGSDKTVTPEKPMVNGDLEVKQELKDLSPVVEVTSSSVKENIYAFERRTERASNHRILTGPQAAALKKTNEAIKNALAGTLSKMHDKEVKAQMKTSKSCPKDFIQEDNEKGDNSSSGVSSDIETMSIDENNIHTPISATLSQASHLLKHRVCTRKGSLPDSGALGIMKDRIARRQQVPQPQPEPVETHSRRQLTKHAVSLSHLPPPTESGESSAEGESIKCEPERKKVYHAKAQAKATNPDQGRADKDLSNLSQSIEQSLQMIRLQVDSLGLAAVTEVDVMTELLPPPPEFDIPTPENGTEPAVLEAIALAPPPEFSDESGMGRKRVVRLASNASDSSGQASSPESAILKQPEVVYHSRGHPHRAPHHSHSQQYANRGAHPRAAPVDNKEPVKIKTVLKEFRQKPLHEWSMKDVCDWLESLFLAEYKPRFTEAGITGAKLANMDNNDLMGLGVKQVGHRLNMERSIKRYLK